MNPTPHEETLFQAALPLAGVERAVFLDRECAEDPAMRARLEALLAAHDQPDTLFATEAGAARPTISLDPAHDLADDLVGERIGRYKLLEKIGEGGCGVVYVAEQTEPVRRRVALKIIKLGMDTKQVVARFEAERQALAMMDHPNIAKVLDAGTTEGGKSETRNPKPETKPKSENRNQESFGRPGLSGAREAALGAASPLPSDGRGVGGEGLPASASVSRTPTGRPYFVMELVRGIRITDYCDQERLSTRDRLDLFIKVCQAIQHAHQKGIIHRDIKPSNILVTLHDGVPVPKVIDFGIAKAVEGRLTDATVYTQLHQFIGTPAYMSPEQAEMSGLDIDTRSDIYSLGVLLYELLTGTTPFDAKELMSQGIDAMRRTIREQEPVRPSTRLTQLRQQERSQSPIANSRGRAAQARAKTGIRNQKSEIESDLDWIVMKCLEKDRGRRYETANGLAADFRRHLNNEPVVARPPSAAYRFRKAWRRNRLAFTAGTAIVVSLLVAVASLLLAFQHTSRALETAQQSAVRLVRTAIMSCYQPEAEQALTDAERSRLPEAQLRYLRGMLLVTTAQPARAIPELEAVRRLEPDNVAALGLLATARIQASGWRAYEPLAAELDRARPVTPDDKLFLGQALAMSDPKRGLPLLDEAIQAVGSPMARIIRAGVRSDQAVQRKDLELLRGALEDIAAAEAWRPDSISVLIAAWWTHRVAAALYRGAGRAAEAETQAGLADNASERLEAFHPNLHALRARLDHLILTGNLEGAIERARRWSGEIPGWNLLYGLVYPLMRHGEFEEAFELTRPPQTDELMQLTHFLAAIELPNHRAEALHMARQVGTNAPRNLNELFVAVTLHLLTDQPDQAEALARSYLKGAGRLDRLLGPSMLRVVRYLADDLSEEALIEGASSALAVGTAQHFVGLRYLQTRDTDAARRHLELSRAVGEAGGPGVHISTFILERLEKNPDWPPTLPRRNGSATP